MARRKLAFATMRKPTSAEKRMSIAQVGEEAEEVVAATEIGAQSRSTDTVILNVMTGCFGSGGSICSERV